LPKMELLSPDRRRVPWIGLRTRLKTDPLHSEAEMLDKFAN
jgi:hypothetical protein